MEDGEPRTVIDTIVDQSTRFSATVLGTLIGHLHAAKAIDMGELAAHLRILAQEPDQQEISGRLISFADGLSSALRDAMPGRPFSVVPRDE
jgi:hypothetical protein